MKKLILISFLLFSLPFAKGWGGVALAQFSDNFTDGDFSANPAWTGETTKFEINGSNQLHLNAPAQSDTAYLSTANSILLSDTVTWEFYFSLSFDPSNNNNLRVYLVSDQENLRGALNGYYVRFGENGASDRLTFFKQSGNTRTEIFAGTANTFGIDPAEGRIKVVRDPLGNWSFYSDTTGGTNYALEGTVNDLSFTSTSYFGLWNKYTSTNSAGFLFDDFNVFYTTIVTGLNTAPAAENLNVYPNPLQGLITVAAEFENTENVRIELTNALGQLVFPAEDILNVAGIKREYNISHLPGGVYFVTLTTDTGKITKRILKN